MGKPQVDAAALFGQLRTHYPDAADFRPLQEGEESRVFAFTVGGDAYVVRLNPSAVGFEKDRMAFKTFGRPELQVPEVILIEPHGPDAFLCISRRAEGQTLQDLPAGGAFAYGAAVGGVMDAMARASIYGATGAGPLGADGMGSHDSWQAFVSDIVNWDWQGLDGEPRTFVSGACRSIVDLARDMPDSRQFVHGDFGSNNVLVASGRITGVIDWSEAMLGDPLYDLANMLFWRPWLDCMEQQCRYFELSEPHRLVQRQRLDCYQMHIGLKVLHDALFEHDKRIADWSLARCRTFAAG